MFGKLPDKDELKSFKRILRGYRTLPDSFVRDVIMKAPSKDMMNGIARSILMLYSYDKHADDNSIDNVLRQCLQLISEMPMISVYSYHAHRHFHCNDSLIIHKPLTRGSIAENILHLCAPTDSIPNSKQRFWTCALCCTQNTAAVTTARSRCTSCLQQARILILRLRRRSAR